MEIDKKAAPTKLLWLDLEMTGLDPAKDRIIEVAAIITDFNFTELGSYKSVIHQSDDVVKSMNPWAAAHHSASGLTAKVRASDKTEDDVIADLVEVIAGHFNGEPAVLAGNSIHNDRIFIKKWWPAVDELLHYRMLDVSSFKVLMQGKWDYNFTKSDTHRADDDIKASIAELQDYLSRLKNES